MTDRPAIRLSFGETSHVIDPTDLEGILDHILSEINTQNLPHTELFRRVDELAKPIRKVLDLSNDFEAKLPRTRFKVSPVIAEEDFKEDGPEVQNGLLVAFKTPLIVNDVKMFTAPVAVAYRSDTSPNHTAPFYDVLKWPSDMQVWVKMERIMITRLYMKGEAGVQVINVMVESTKPTGYESRVDLLFSLDTPTLKLQGELTSYGLLQFNIGYDLETPLELIGMDLIAEGTN